MPQPNAVNLVLPTPPALNHLHFSRVVTPKFGGKKAFVQRGLTADGIAYKNDVAKEAKRLGIVPFVGDVGVTIKWFRPRRVGDLDGIFKIVLDSLTGFAYHDDKQIKRLRAERFEDKLNPRVEIEIRAMGLC
ncbi:MAG: RusA family crossover junction endodeoxyribonuclease [Chloracidobacterium sp.]|nr:RusA family crossover junction endodeoxyribonuclease [Chloracidobacterium sp.]